MSRQIPADAVYLRVKRKREDEPATHMLAEIVMPGAKKMRDSSSLVPGVFTFAETVEDSSLFESKQYIEGLNKRVVTMSLAPPQASPSRESEMSLSSTVPSETNLPDLDHGHSPTKTARSYTIVPSPQDHGHSPRRPSRPTAPPVVKSTSASASRTVRFYEAVESGNGAEYSADTEDPAMEQFADMVNDYLQLSSDGPSSSAAGARPAPASPTIEKGTSRADDYVYDVFYFALKDVNDVNELLAQEAANIGTVHGLPYWQFTNHSPDNDSDDSVKDEADEDSNDEDYYTNDYPEEEVSDNEEEIEAAWRPWRY